MHGRDTEERDKNLKKVLERLSEKQLTVNAEKCIFGMNKVVFMGLYININILITGLKGNFVVLFIQTIHTEKLIRFPRYRQYAILNCLEQAKLKKRLFASISQK